MENRRRILDNHGLCSVRNAAARILKQLNSVENAVPASATKSKRASPCAHETRRHLPKRSTVMVKLPSSRSHQLCSSSRSRTSWRGWLRCCLLRPSRRTHRFPYGSRSWQACCYFWYLHLFTSSERSSDIPLLHH